LVTEVAGPLLIEEEVLLHDDLMHQVLDTVRRNYNRRERSRRVGIWGIEAGVSHDGDHHMLLHVELAGVKAPGVSEGGKLASRKDLFQEFTCRETAIHDKPSVAARGGLERAGRTATGQR
jgi:hypothetical protein